MHKLANLDTVIYHWVSALKSRKSKVTFSKTLKGDEILNFVDKIVQWSSWKHVQSEPRFGEELASLETLWSRAYINSFEQKDIVR